MSRLPAALNAAIEGTPAMVPEDLQKAAPAIEQAVKEIRLDSERSATPAIRSAVEPGMNNMITFASGYSAVQRV
jgi:hypothetical protein